MHIEPDMHHTWLRIMPCLGYGCLLCCVLLSGVCFFGLVPVTSRLWGPVRLRPIVFFMDSFFFLAGSQARWSYPQNHYYLCFTSCLDAIAMSRYLPLVYQASQIAVKPPLTFFTLPSKPLFGYVTALLSPSYSVVSCRWRLEVVPCWNIYLLVGVSLYCLLS